ncbi:MAG: prepilin-type N-terminal cleavage/methylation domain-containing protein [Peptococcaceae bacterium]
MRSEKGFTLAEMLVVLVLLTILCTAVAPSLYRNWQQATMDFAIQQLHRDLRWAQWEAGSKQKKMTVTFYRDRQPYRYVIRYAGQPLNLRYRTLPGSLDKLEAQTIIIETDKRFQKNGHVLLQKGDCKRYVYYYQTGRSRVTKKATG